jgi:hypothetical protein
MANPYFNLTQDGTKVFDQLVENVNFYLVENGLLAGSAGHLSKSGVKITLTEESTNLITNENYQRGYNLNVEITSEQFYGAFEFEKLRNKKCYIELPEIPLWVLPVRLNISFPEFNPGEKKATVVIKSSKYCKTLNNAIASSWNGTVSAPFALPNAGPGTDSPIPSTGAIYSEWKLSLTDPTIEIITPAAPDADDPITEAKLALTDIYAESIIVEPTVTAVERWDGFTWTALVVTTDYTVIYEDGAYKIHIDNAALTALLLGVLVRATFTEG